jgi:hypothetical protein
MRFTAWFFAILIVPATCLAQFKNILIDDSTEGRPPCEPTISISRKDPSVLVAGSILNRYYYSADGGHTWAKGELESSYGVWGDPVIINDKKGHFYYFHLSDPTGKNWASEEILDRIVVQKSKDNGRTWSNGSYFGHNPPKDQDKPWAAVDRQKNILYATWTQFDKYGSKDPNDKSNILFSKSKNGGKSWSKPVQLNQFSGDCVDGSTTTEGAVPAVGLNGRLFVAWSLNEKIYFDRSYDGGVTWLNNDLVVATQPGGWKFTVPGVNRTNGMPVVACDVSGGPFSGTIYVNWADQRNGPDDTDIWISRSRNNGDNWSEPIRVNTDGAGKHQFLTWMAVDQASGALFVVFYDRRDHEGNETDVYLAYSLDGGASFKNVKISEEPFTPEDETFFGDYNNIDVHKGLITPIWTRMDNGKTSVWTSIIRIEDLVPEWQKEKSKKEQKAEKKASKSEK